MDQIPIKLDYVNSMMVVDKNLNVLYTVRINSISKDGLISNDYLEYCDKYYFDVYPNLNPLESSMVKCLNTGKIICYDNQTFTDFRGKVYTTRNITFPIIRHGEIVGAIELSQDITSIADLEANSDKKCLQKKSITNISDLEAKITFEDIKTQDPEMLQTIQRAKLLANLESPILIYGETGTGKELFVQAIANSNKHRKGKLIAYNCAAIPESLFESILFGSKKGAFTGAEDKPGLFELADGGTLFLDELNSIPTYLQAKLLRVLQDGIIRPIGSSTEKKLNVRVIVAINQNPLQLIKENKLREDLFYRLSGNMLYLKPLRERKNDIPLYAEYFIKQMCDQYNIKKHYRISSGLMSIFNNYNWPGNVREFKHVIESMVNTATDEVLTIKNLPVYLKDSINFEPSEVTQSSNIENDSLFKMSLNEILENTERHHILKALKFTNGNIVKAAEILGLPRQTLKYRMDKLNITFKKTE
ncbi:MAG: sigma 54-interacting transcriptional regulator [Clostridiales bacterium]|nr:sigma 54-interacting transcriptional regulator [Clostridiales bacterium]